MFYTILKCSSLASHYESCSCEGSKSCSFQDHLGSVSLAKPSHLGGSQPWPWADHPPWVAPGATEAEYSIGTNKVIGIPPPIVFPQLLDEPLCLCWLALNHICWRIRETSCLLPSLLLFWSALARHLAWFPHLLILKYHALLLPIAQAALSSQGLGNPVWPISHCALFLSATLYQSPASPHPHLWRLWDPIKSSWYTASVSFVIVCPSLSLLPSN